MNRRRLLKVAPLAALGTLFPMAASAQEYIEEVNHSFEHDNVLLEQSWFDDEGTLFSMQPSYTDVGNVRVKLTATYGYLPWLHGERLYHGDPWEAVIFLHHKHVKEMGIDNFNDYLVMIAREHASSFYQHLEELRYSDMARMMGLE